MKYYVVDAFTDELFRGNPAGVCPLECPLDEALMQRIAAENNLAETAFFVAKEGGRYDLRWFTPEAEIDLCGHATLASGYVVFRFLQPEWEEVHFDTQSGPLTVRRRGELLEMDFPSRPPAPVEITPQMEEAVGCRVLEARMSRDLVLLLEDEKTVRELEPDMQLIQRIPDALGVVVTARGTDCDFVSRFFAPGVDIGVPEDPVTGSTHCNLIPYWAEKLGKRDFLARQLSRRGGTLYCRDEGDRVSIAGEARLYLIGEIQLDKNGGAL